MYGCLRWAPLLLRLLAVPVSACQGMPHRCDSAMPPLKDCACCCSQVKSKKAEQALPEFNLAKVVGSRIQKQGFRQAVLLCVVRQPRRQARGCALALIAVHWHPSTSAVTSENHAALQAVCSGWRRQQPVPGSMSTNSTFRSTLLPEVAVPAASALQQVLPMLPVQVDLADFDGSLPRLALQALLQASGTKGSDLRLVIAANKVDLLPKQAVRERLEVRQTLAALPAHTQISLDWELLVPSTTTTSC